MAEKKVTDGRKSPAANAGERSPGTRSRSASKTPATVKRSRARPAKPSHTNGNREHTFARARVAHFDAHGSMAAGERRMLAELASGSVGPLQSPLQAGLPDWRRFTGRFMAEDFGNIRIAFEGQQTKVDWADRLSEVNSSVFQNYFWSTQTSDAIEMKGVDGSRDLVQSSNWGTVIWQIDNLNYSSRFGGCFHVRLRPTEDIGPELGDKGQNLYLNLEHWSLNVYIQPTNALFNTPQTAPTQITSRMLAELEILGYEAYQLSSGIFVPHPSPDEGAVDSLISDAAQEAAGRLRPLGLFVLGFVHNKWIPDFESIDERVTEVHLSNNLCKIETEIKRPYVRIWVKTSYQGTGDLEGPFSGDPDFVADPQVTLWGDAGRTRSPLFLNSIEKRLGAGSSTGFLNFGYLSLAEFSQTKLVQVKPWWDEEDLLLDDFSYSASFEFDVSYDADELQDRADQNDLGTIEPALMDTQGDEKYSFLSYFVHVRFELVKI